MKTMVFKLLAKGISLVCLMVLFTSCVDSAREAEIADKYYRELPNGDINTFFLEYEDPIDQNGKLIETNCYSLDFGFRIVHDIGIVHNKNSVRDVGYDIQSGSLYVRPTETICAREIYDSKPQNSMIKLFRDNSGLFGVISKVDSIHALSAPIDVFLGGDSENDNELECAKDALYRILTDGNIRHEAILQGNRLLENWFEGLGLKKENLIIIQWNDLYGKPIR